MKRNFLMFVSLFVMEVFLSRMLFAQGAGNMLSFGDDDDKVEVADNSNLEVGTGSFTIEAWIKLSSCDDWVTIVEKGESTTWFNNSYSFGVNHSGNHVRFKGNWSDGEELDSDESLDLNKWYHVAGVRDGDDAYIYINGIKDVNENNNCDGGTATTGKKLMIGWDASSQFLDGTMDELRIWNVARSQTEIREWMNKTNGLTSETGLVSVWHFNESSVGASSVIDSKGGYNGTPSNMANSDCVTSSAAIGDESHIGTGTSNLSETIGVPVDITWDAGGDPGSGAIFSAIQVNESPEVSTGLLTNYAGKYWEIWIANDDGSFQADVKFHYDNITTIDDESTLKLYTRADATGGWSEVASYTINNEGNNTDGTGSITANNLTHFSQFIITSSSNSSLPIDLLDFSVKKYNENSVVINWQTASETDNDYFIIQRSSDINNWEDVLKIKGAGNSNEIINYIEYDNKLKEGLSYYRLKQIDYNGKFSYSKIISINTLIHSKSSFTIYPNPTKGLITITDLSSAIEQDEYKVQVINSIGSVVKQFTTKDSRTVFQINNLKKGIYFIKIIARSETVIKKIVLE